MYKYGDSVLKNISGKPEFEAVWSKWCEDCRNTSALPDFTPVKTLILKYSDAAEVLTHNELDTYYASAYMRIAHDLYWLKDFDSKLTFK